MEYVLDTIFKDEAETEPGVSGSIVFPFHVKHKPEQLFPAFLFIYALGVQHKLNKVLLNDNFLGYLSARSQTTVLEVDNGVMGNLKQRGNCLRIEACDEWGNGQSQSPLRLDVFKVAVVQVAYSMRRLQYVPADQLPAVNAMV